MSRRTDRHKADAEIAGPEASFVFWLAAWAGTAMSGAIYGMGMLLLSDPPRSPSTALILGVASVFGAFYAGTLGVTTLSVTCVISLLARCPNSLSAASAGGALAGVIAARLLTLSPAEIAVAAAAGGAGAFLTSWAAESSRQRRTGDRVRHVTLKRALLVNVYVAIVLSGYAIAVR